MSKFDTSRIRHGDDGHWLCHHCDKPAVHAEAAPCSGQCEQALKEISARIASVDWDSLVDPVTPEGEHRAGAAGLLRDEFRRRAVDDAVAGHTHPHYGCLDHLAQTGAGHQVIEHHLAAAADAGK